MKPGDSFPVAGYELRLDGVAHSEGANFSADTATIAILRDGREIGTLHPEKRFYPVQRMPTTEAAIDRGLTRDLYVALGDPQDNGGWAVRTYVKPFASWIWIGALIMAAGGAISLTDRRYRVGAPARRAPRPAVATPAE
jgi:cytochrome c-type biogenesis protein CcmF